MPNDWAGLLLFEVLVLSQGYKVCWWGNGEKKYLILSIFTGKRFISRIVVPIRTKFADLKEAQDKVLGDTVYAKNVLFPEWCIIWMTVKIWGK